jgi:hypothetical protein
LKTKRTVAFGFLFLLPKSEQILVNFCAPGRFIVEPKGLKSNYFGEDLEKINRKRPDGLIQRW